eukprot:TRINITY_DN1749_c0_g1_i3.p1 TRINITY_DN1749_c0_g1~~TRINITY_DN1749_c0_g1_i3.p1  ORF type:complete len:712 (-),score=148.01 TRINITY_DN1749_c0_g1_i3:40-2118(-)
MASIRTAPVEGPAAWKATDESIKNESWKTWVTEEQIAEFDAALKATAEKEVHDIVKEDLPPMPGVAQAMKVIQSDLEEGRGFAMLRGLPVQRWGMEQTTRGLWILGLHLGSAEPQDKEGALIHHVKDTGMKPGDNATVRYYQTNVAIPFHTDGCDALAFLCYSKGLSGGLSRLTSAVTAFNVILERRPDLAKVLQENFHFDARGQHPNGELCQVHPVYMFHNGNLNLIHKVPYIMSAQRLEGVPKLTAAQQEALDFLDVVMNEKEHVLEFESEPGDIQFVSNHTQCHGRTAFEDDADASGATRHFLRLWVTLPNGHELPPHYVETREHMHGFVRRMPVDVEIMDGSMGRLLMNSGVPQDPDIWSGLSITDEQYHPKVIEAHRKYIDGGADMITTNSYTVQPCYYRKKYDDWEARLPKDAETSARLAVEAVRQSNLDRPVRVLGSLPPLCESHRPDLATEFIAKEGRDFIVKTYRAIASGLLKGGPVDAFIAETMNTWEEASCAIEAVKDLGKPLIVSMQGSLRSLKLKAQPHLAAAIAENILTAKAEGAPIEALCLNCAPPEDIAAAVKVLDEKGYRARLHAAGIRLGAYANVQQSKECHEGEGFSAENVGKRVIKVRDDLVNEGYIKHLHHFIQCGVSYIGGCCGSTPEQIRMLTDSLHSVNGTEGPAPKRRRLQLLPSAKHKLEWSKQGA